MKKRSKKRKNEWERERESKKCFFRYSHSYEKFAPTQQ
jgi:hypothetical protein